MSEPGPPGTQVPGGLFLCPNRNAQAKIGLGVSFSSVFQQLRLARRAPTVVRSHLREASGRTALGSNYFFFLAAFLAAFFGAGLAAFFAAAFFLATVLSSIRCSSRSRRRAGVGNSSDDSRCHKQPTNVGCSAWRSSYSQLKNLASVRSHQVSDRALARATANCSSPR